MVASVPQSAVRVHLAAEAFEKHITRGRQLLLAAAP
jgi:hypothetical protein